MHWRHQVINEVHCGANAHAIASPPLTSQKVLPNAFRMEGSNWEYRGIVCTHLEVITWRFDTSLLLLFVVGFTLIRFQ